MNGLVDAKHGLIGLLLAFSPNLLQADTCSCQNQKAEATASGTCTRHDGATLCTIEFASKNASATLVELQDSGVLTDLAPFGSQDVGDVGPDRNMDTISSAFFALDFRERLSDLAQGDPGRFADTVTAAMLDTLILDGFDPQAVSDSLRSDADDLVQFFFSGDSITFYTLPNSGFNVGLGFVEAGNVRLQTPWAIQDMDSF